jgi:RNase P subunit RPR2
MTQIARSTCVKCHKILPRTEMTQVKKRVKSGDSIGASGSLFGNKKGQRNIRISSRDYYRNKLVWMCHECADSESFFGSSDDENSSNWIYWLVVFFVFFVFFKMSAYFVENSNNQIGQSSSIRDNCNVGQTYYDETKREWFVCEAPYNTVENDKNPVRKINSSTSNCRKGVMFFDKSKGEWVDCDQNSNSIDNNKNQDINLNQKRQEKNNIEDGVFIKDENGKLVRRISCLKKISYSDARKLGIAPYHLIQANNNCDYEVYLTDHTDRSIKALAPSSATYSLAEEIYVESLTDSINKCLDELPFEDKFCFELHTEQLIPPGVNNAEPSYKSSTDNWN